MSQATTANRTTKQGKSMKEVLPNIKDLGLIGMVIYTLWIDNSTNKTDIQSLRQADAATNTRIEVLQVNYDHIDKQLDRIESLLDSSQPKASKDGTN